MNSITNDALRPARLITDVESRYLGLAVGRPHKAGKKVKVQQSTRDPAYFVLWFGKTEIAMIPASSLSTTIQFIPDSI